MTCIQLSETEPQERRQISKMGYVQKTISHLNVRRGLALGEGKAKGKRRARGKGVENG